MTTARIPRGLERRQHPRVKAICLVTYRSLGDGPPARQGLAATIDLSRGGMKLWLSRSLEVPEELEFRIALRDRIVRVPGRLVYTSEVEDDRFIAGVRFKRIPDRTRHALEDFLEGKPRLTPQLAA